jgi:PAS domain S-box-containing protein
VEKAAEQTFAVTERPPETIRTVTSAMIEEFDLPVLLKLLVQRAVELIDIADMGALYLWDEATQTLVPQAWHNIGEWIREVRLKPGEGMAGAVVQRRQGLAVDAYKHAPYAFSLFMERLEQTAVIAEPLFYGAHLIGVISLSATTPGRSFTSRDCELLAWFASHAAMTIVNVQLFAESQMQAAELAQANIALQRGMKEHQRADELFRLAVESAPNAMVMINHTGHIELVNSQTEILFGYHRDELLGQPIEILVPERFRQQHPAERARFLKTPMVRAMGVGRELYGLRKDGSEFPVEIGLNPIQTDEGFFVLSAVIDITERKRAEERFRIAVESAPNAVVMINQDGHIVLVNSQTEQLFGYSRDELLGQSIDILVPERFRRMHPDYRRDFFVQPTARAMGVGRDLYGLRKDGTEFPVEIGLTPVTTDDGVFVLSAIVDITERKRIEEQLQHYIAELERSNKELDAFAYVASHDLKAPLRAMDSLAQWIAEDAEDVLPADSRRHLQTLRQRVKRLEGLLDDLLDYSRAGQEQAPIEVIDTGVLVASIVELLAPPPTFTVTVAPDMPTLRASKAPLGQIFRNLIGNAIKHHHRLDGRVEVTAHDHRRMWEFVVADDGPGIPAAYHGRIFQMFQTLKPRDEVEGSGIGLAVVRKIITSRGGTITVESAEGQGARFRFTWPKQELRRE